MESKGMQISFRWGYPTSISHFVHPPFEMKPPEEVPLPPMMLQRLKDWNINLASMVKKNRLQATVPMSLTVIKEDFLGLRY